MCAHNVYIIEIRQTQLLQSGVYIPVKETQTSDFNIGK